VAASQSTWRCSHSSNLASLSLLNAALGEVVLPVGVVPLTTVITRASAGPERVVRVTRLNGIVKEIALSRLADFVTESGNPGNQRQVAVVDV
jgi:hypothetical protein